MTDKKKDAIDNFIDFILSDETPVGPEDEKNVQMVKDALAQAEIKLAKGRLERAKAGASTSKITNEVTNIDLERARRSFDRAKNGDQSSGITLAARFGKGEMDDDLEAILQDLAELQAEEDSDDEN